MCGAIDRASRYSGMAVVWSNNAKHFGLECPAGVDADGY